jgi:hypothetical protein
MDTLIEYLAKFHVYKVSAELVLSFRQSEKFTRVKVNS